jgi:hypothetical protein
MSRKRKVKRWIQRIPIKKGALHKQLGVPLDKVIPIALLNEASHAPGKLGRRARLALKFRQFKDNIPRNK